MNRIVSWLGQVGLASLCLVSFVFGVSGGASAEPDGYQYSVDWTNSRGEEWMKHLSRFRGKPGAQGLEVGCLEGRSTLWFVDNVLTHPTAKMTCVDIFEPQNEARFDNNVRVSGHAEKIIKHKGYSQDVLRTLEYDTYDFVYIDGCHLASCVLSDAVLVWDLLKPGAILIFDDYFWRMHKPANMRPKLAVDVFVESFLEDLEVLGSVNKQLFLRKTKGRTKLRATGDQVVEWPVRPVR